MSSPTTSGSASGGRYGAAPTTTSAALVATKQSKLGVVLAGLQGKTLYLFEADTGAASTCSGACAALWPPLTTTGTAKAGGSAQASDIGTIKRADGATQVTYKGHPLYYYAKDKDSGDSYGQGIKSFGAAWYVLAPSGNKIDKS